MTDQLPNEYWESLSQSNSKWSSFTVTLHGSTGTSEATSRIKCLPPKLSSRHTQWHHQCGLGHSIQGAEAIVVNPQASIPIQTSHNSTQNAKAANPKPFNGNCDKTEEFVRAVQIMVTMQVDTFMDKRMKVLYALSFMHATWRTTQVWAANETMAVINRKSQMQTLDIFLENVERTFGDPDRACTASWP